MKDKKPENMKKKIAASCDVCEHFDTDDDGENFCNVDLDEDEAAALRVGGSKSCPYFKFYDEYKSVQKQN